MATMAYDYIDGLHRIEFDYVSENMCRRNKCPCSTKIDPGVFGLRQIELNSLEIFEGSISNFYFECYLPLVDAEKMDPLEDKTIDLLELWETEKDCSGICKVPLFYFYKGN